MSVDLNLRGLCDLIAESREARSAVKRAYWRGRIEEYCRQNALDDVEDVRRAQQLLDEDWSRER